jgi:hypothetical protein
VAGSCEHDNEPSGCIIGQEFLMKPSGFQLFKENCAPLELFTYCVYPVSTKEAEPFADTFWSLS